jgi:hypothetical protein
MINLFQNDKTSVYTQRNNSQNVNEAAIRTYQALAKERFGIEIAVPSIEDKKHEEPLLAYVKKLYELIEKNKILRIPLIKEFEIEPCKKIKAGETAGSYDGTTIRLCHPASGGQLDEIFNHESTHNAHKVQDFRKYNDGLISLLTKNELSIYNKFRNKGIWNDLIQKKSDFKTLFNKFLLNETPSREEILSKNYNMKNLRKNYSKFLKIIKRNPELKKDFEPEFLSDMGKIINKLGSAIDFIKVNIKNCCFDYHLANTSETIAVAIGEREMSGDTEGLLHPTFRHFLEKLGAPSAKTVSYLPEDYFGKKMDAYFEDSSKSSVKVKNFFNRIFSPDDIHPMKKDFSKFHDLLEQLEIPLSENVSY